jgi:hypothetical protein
MFLINNELIWISIPRCASVSIENSIYNSSLNIKKIISGTHLIEESKNKIIPHFHSRKKDCIDYFGHKDTICITRNWLDRLLSAFEFFFYSSAIQHNNELICNWEDVDNAFIYKHFNNNFANAIYSENQSEVQNYYNSLFIKINKNLPGTLYIFNSQKYWKENEKCTYEFDITEIDKFINFINNKFGVKLEITKMNDTKKIKNKIEVNNELKTFLWDTFESRFVKKGNLI